MRIGSVRLHVEWGHLAFVLFMAAFCVWFWLDARAASTNVQNLLVIQPAAIFALLLCAAIAIRLVKIERMDPVEGSPGKHASAASVLRALWRAGELRGILVAALLGAYVFGVPLAGFDLATFLFLAAGMFVLGERRPLFLGGFSALFALALSYGFKVMLSVPVPTLLF